jgi:hypothetical protein
LSITLELDERLAKRVRRRSTIGRFVSAMAWGALVVAMAASGELLGAAIVALVALPVGWFTEWALRSDARLAALKVGGLVVLADEGIYLSHPAVLVRREFVPWEHVQAVIVDAGSGRGFRYEVDERNRYLLDGPASGIDPTHRPPLLATVPVRPNVLLLIDPPADLSWCHPDPRSLSFVGFRAMGAMARPWSEPAATPAVWFRLLDVDALGSSDNAMVRLQRLTKADVHRLRLALGDLPTPRS